MAEPTIRLIQLSDLEDIVKLCKQHAEYEKSDYDSTNKKELLARYLFTDTPVLFCLVAELNDEIVAYATYMKQFSTWDAEYYIYMDCLFVTEVARGFGIGEKLTDRIKLEGAKLNCNHIQWQTPDFNKRAMKFYGRIGARSKSKERYFLDI